MPRRVIPIRTGPTAYDFQDSASGLTDGLAQAIATLAALPTQNAQIRQQGDFQLAQVNRQNRIDDQNLERQNTLDAQHWMSDQLTQDRQRKTDKRLAERDAHANHNDDLSNALNLGVAPAGMENDPQFKAAIGEHARRQGMADDAATAAHDRQSLENALTQARTQDIAIRGATDARGHFMHSLGDFAKTGPSQSAPKVHTPTSAELGEAKDIALKQALAEGSAVINADGKVEVKDHKRMRDLSNASAQNLGVSLPEFSDWQEPAPAAQGPGILDYIRNLFGSTSPAAMPGFGAGGPQAEDGAAPADPTAPALTAAQPAAPGKPRGVVRRSHLQDAVNSGHYRSIDEAAADAQRQGFAVVP